MSSKETIATLLLVIIFVVIINILFLSNGDISLEENRGKTVDTTKIDTVFLNNFQNNNQKTKTDGNKQIVR
jgi:hypothetical protein